MITLTNPEALTLLVCAVLALICAYAFGWARGHESRCDSCNLEPDGEESQDEKNRRMAASLAAMPVGPVTRTVVAGVAPMTAAAGVDWGRVLTAPDTESAIRAARQSGLPPEWIKEMKVKPAPEFMRRADKQS